MKMYKALTIAGSDSSGGAGIQADLEAFQELGVYGLTALTTIVAMDPDNYWFHHVYPIDIEIVKQQLKTSVTGVGVDAVKTGMLGSPAIIELAAEAIEAHGLKNVVIDPVMVCKGTDDSEELQPENTKSLREILVPKATIVTPNLFEAAKLSQMPPITSREQMKEAAVAIHALGAKNVFIKGGSKLDAVDLLYDGNDFEWLETEKLDTTYTHGAGCTTAAAITAELAKGRTVKEAVKTAKQFITQAIRHSFKLNQYVGAVNRFAYRTHGEQ
ncbi:pyridoxine/pyridoxal/pyridoxamine kinase [Numidum massiliense]|uniref:pyridoxine/pyridoxal/pyridoxamine kinase n=1 Tax=Numidum massiliense TaxID=1522315 RepID=UPI0006D5357A|nr:pyridoxine/pyridoxal/pyridoxamine kinase [Numidum massiliense]